MWATSNQIKELYASPLSLLLYPAKMPQKHCVASVWLAVVLTRCLIVSRSVTVRSESDKFKFQVNCNITKLYTVPLKHCEAVQYPCPQGCELVMPQRSPDIARFRVGTGNSCREKDAIRKGKKTEIKGER